jgi:pilus assembly protein CpaC
MSRIRALRSCALIGGLLAALALAPLTAGPAEAQSSVRLSTGATGQSITLPRGRSSTIDLPLDARDVIISNPAVAEAILHTPRRITLVGLAPGEADAVFLDAAGRTILSLNVRVDAGTAALSDTLRRVMPGSNIQAEAVNESIILTGHALNNAEADRAVSLARQFVSSPERVLNLITVAGSDQVTVRVRVVEVQRTVIKQLGFDIDALVQNAADGFSFSLGSTFGVNAGQVGGANIGYTNPGSTNLTTNLRAFERVGLVRMLAEPNLTSVHGESASFLAGGEFPVPVGRDREGNILVEFKPYGVSLAFRPMVMSEGRISLQISVEVSELSTQGALTLGAGTPNALTLPGLTVRRTQNTVEMPSGGAMMIAGLLQESTRQNIDSLPGITNLPVLGTLFRSRDFLSGETELVVIVEPYIVSPTAPGRLQTPADGLRIASDSQTILFGRLNEAYGAPRTAPGTPAPAWHGPVGYVIE